jgi:putative DNA methylase
MVIAWLWVRTVTCPNPACGAQMPLASKWWLSQKKDKETWAEPEIDHTTTPPTIRFAVETGKGKPQDGTVNRQGAKCIACSTPVLFDYIRREGRINRIGQQLMAIVAQGQKRRVYLAPNNEHAAAATQAEPRWVPETELPDQALGFRVQLYGLTKHCDLFTRRQLVALTTFSDLVEETKNKVLLDVKLANLLSEEAYADAVTTYLTLVVDRCTDYWSSICSWHTGADKMRNTFTRQAISMIWDSAEANPFSDSSGNFMGAISWVAGVIRSCFL